METERPGMKEYTCQEIHSLASRLRSGEVHLLDVISVVNQRYTQVTGEPHIDEDHGTVEALKELADAMAEVWERDGVHVLHKAIEHLGYGVATGKFGGDFFKNIK